MSLFKSVAPLPTQEDAVEYRIFVRNASLPLSDLAQKFNAVIRDSFIKDYLWQEESMIISEFKNSTTRDDETSLQSLPPHLYGETRFGDNIDDEWFIVWILFELSKLFPDVSVSVTDNDGQFLLIEAANWLPGWVNPDNSDGRVWIRNGRLHIIPHISQAGAPKTIVPPLSIPQGLQHLHTLSLEQTLAPQKAEEAILKRISVFPKHAVLSSSQFYRCRVPLNVAKILRKEPKLIAPVTKAFYHRDPILLKESSKLKRMGTEPMVDTMVRFNRCMFAQLLGQEYHPPSSYGVLGKESSEYESFLMGAKVAVGVEMLYVEEKKRTKKRLASKALATFEFEKDEEWLEYERKLVEVGYFRTEGSGSALHKSLLKKAKLRFLEACVVDKLPRETSPGDMPINEKIDRLLEETSAWTAEDFGSDKLTPNTPTDWLDISPQELDGILADREEDIEEYFETDNDIEIKPTEKNPEPKRPKTNATNPSDLYDSLLSSMGQFMKSVSDVDGVENMDDLGFNADEFMKTMKDILEKDPGQFENQADSDYEGDDFYAMGSDSDIDDQNDLDMGEMKSVMEAMDRELSAQGMLNEFDTVPTFSSDGDTADESNGDAPVDVNMNLVKNLLESYAAQHGMPGPASSLLDEFKPKSAKK